MRLSIIAFGNAVKHVGHGDPELVQDVAAGFRITGGPKPLWCGAISRMRKTFDELSCAHRLPETDDEHIIGDHLVRKATEEVDIGRWRCYAAKRKMLRDDATVRQGWFHGDVRRGFFFLVPKLHPFRDSPKIFNGTCVSDVIRENIEIAQG